jgi:hypothetical protein
MSQVKPLPADSLYAIYDINTHILYLVARGTYVTPTLTSFARRTWLGDIKYAFEGFYDNAGDNADDKSKPTENQFAEGFGIILADIITHILIVTADGIETVDILRVPLLQS